MSKLFMALATAVAVATPALAQDVTGNINPSTYSGPMVMHSAIDAQARNNRNTRSVASPTRSAQTCANLPKVRARLGAHDARVQKLSALCQQAGY